MPKRAVTLKGSCHCGQVSFSLKSNTIYPYQRCYCSICRKTQGGGGYAINLGGEAKSMKVKGEDNISVYHARVKNPEDKIAHRSGAQRHFCKLCGTALWLFDPSWPELIHPFSSCIDSKLPVPSETTHIMLEFKAPWVVPQIGKRDKKFKRYPKESIAELLREAGELVAILSQSVITAKANANGTSNLKPNTSNLKTL